MPITDSRDRSSSFLTASSMDVCCSDPQHGTVGDFWPPLAPPICGPKFHKSKDHVAINRRAFQVPSDFHERTFVEFRIACFVVLVHPHIFEILRRKFAVWISSRARTSELDAFGSEVLVAVFDHLPGGGVFIRGLNDRFGHERSGQEKCARQLQQPNRRWTRLRGSSPLIGRLSLVSITPCFVFFSAAVPESPLTEDTDTSRDRLRCSPF